MSARFNDTWAAVVRFRSGQVLLPRWILGLRLRARRFSMRSGPARLGSPLRAVLAREITSEQYIAEIKRAVTLGFASHSLMRQSARAVFARAARLLAS